MLRFPVDVPDFDEVTFKYVTGSKGCPCGDVEGFSLTYPWSETTLSSVPSSCDAGIITTFLSILLLKGSFSSDLSLPHLPLFSTRTKPRTVVSCESTHMETCREVLVIFTAFRRTVQAHGIDIIMPL